MTDTYAPEEDRRLCWRCRHRHDCALLRDWVRKGNVGPCADPATLDCRAYEPDREESA